MKGKRSGSKNSSAISSIIKNPRPKKPADFDAPSECPSKFQINELLHIRQLNLPPDAWRDHKKLTAFLTEVTDTVNKLVEAVTKHVKNTGIELAARPTYAEEYVHIRDNMAKRAPSEGSMSRQPSVSKEEKPSKVSQISDSDKRDSIQRNSFNKESV